MLGAAIDRRSRTDSCDPNAVAEALDRDGFVYVPGRDDSDLVAILEALGEPIFVEEVRASPGSRSLVCSSDGIPWHTDHHRADRIVWYGRVPAETGGETLVVDGLAAYRELSTEHQTALRRTALTEHRVFTDDREEHPIASERRGRVQLYLSFWQAPNGMGATERNALDAFRRAVSRLRPQRFLLRRGDILAIDNTRMLHARTPIGGRAGRHLRRYWLSAG